uniref:2-isopropylmalate synthase LeuA allosteric (dimerisation) domain-containing protein n=1 Tax=Eiseniibacteriota bacterium TaxID=2212470 RepID=A0A832I380_UNCEI
MPMESRQSWTQQLESALKTLRDVEGASVQAAGSELREIHVLTASTRPAKQIVRDVQTLLLTRFGRAIDHRVVSVAYTAPGGSPAPAAAPAPFEAAPAPVPAPTPDGRIRFGSVNVYVAGPRAQAQVELRWKGIERVGSAAGNATREQSHHLVAAATVHAIEEFLEEGWALGVSGVEVVRVGRRDVAVVTLSLLAHRDEKVLVGSCSVEQDVPQAVALATLAALNRVVGALETREPTEYVLRPASTQEDSEAK